LKGKINTKIWGEEEGCKIWEEESAATDGAPPSLVENRMTKGEPGK